MNDMKSSPYSVDHSEQVLDMVKQSSHNHFVDANEMVIVQSDHITRLEKMVWNSSHIISYLHITMIVEGGSFSEKVRRIFGEYSDKMIQQNDCIFKNQEVPS